MNLILLCFRVFALTVPMGLLEEVLVLAPPPDV